MKEKKWEYLGNLNMVIFENLSNKDNFRLNKMMNRLTAYSKGLNPDDENINQDKSFMNAFKVNNVFFRVSKLNYYESQRWYFN